MSDELVFGLCMAFVALLVTALLGYLVWFGLNSWVTGYAWGAAVGGEWLIQAKGWAILIHWPYLVFSVALPGWLIGWLCYGWGWQRSQRAATAQRPADPMSGAGYAQPVPLPPKRDGLRTGLRDLVRPLWEELKVSKRLEAALMASRRREQALTWQLKALESQADLETVKRQVTEWRAEAQAERQAAAQARAEVEAQRAKWETARAHLAQAQAELARREAAWKAELSHLHERQQALKRQAKYMQVQARHLKQALEQAKQDGHAPELRTLRQLINRLLKAATDTAADDHQAPSPDQAKLAKTKT